MKQFLEAARLRLLTLVGPVPIKVQYIRSRYAGRPEWFAHIPGTDMHSLVHT